MVCQKTISAASGGGRATAVAPGALGANCGGVEGVGSEGAGGGVDALWEPSSFDTFSKALNQMVSSFAFGPPGYFER